VYLVDRAAIAVADCTQADAKISKGLDEAEFDEVAKAEFDLIVIVLIVWLP
jgi:hypothetical protein